MNPQRWRWTLFDGYRPWPRPAFCWSAWARGAAPKNP